MKKLIYLFIIVHCTLYIDNCMCQVVQEWEARYTGPYNSDGAYAMCLDNYGNVFVTGRSDRNTHISDYATVKFNKWGNLVWAARYNWPGDTNGLAMAYSIAADNKGNVYVTGKAPVTISGYPNKITTVKYDSSGNQKWVVIYYSESYISSPGDRLSIAVSNSYHIYVAGSTYFTNNGYNYTLIKYDSSGVQQWMVRYHGPGTQNGAEDNQPTCITLDDKENIYVSGFSRGDTTYNDIATIKYDSSGAMKWVARYNGPGNKGDSATGIKVDNFGNVYVTGATCRGIYSGWGARYDYVTIKYDSSGAQKWASFYKGDNSTYGNRISNAIDVDASGNSYVTGYLSSTITYEVECATVKYDSSGVQKWVSNYEYEHNTSWGVALALDNLGYVYVAANSYQGIPSHYATIKYSPTGSQEWSMRTYSVNGEAPKAIVVDNQRNVYVTGGPSYLTIKYSQPTGINPISNEIPDTYRLEQNYPNPFNSMTNIKFQMLNAGNAKIIVFDILGKEVATLVNEKLKAGKYEISFDAGKLSSGIYLYKFITDGFSETKKMMMIK